jgi:phenylacetate-CoA ligase
MTYDLKMEIYWRLPVFLQQAALQVYARDLDGLYYAPGFQEWQRLGQSWRSWSPREAKQWQNSRLQQLVELAATQVPHYREKWKARDWRSVRSATDLPLLPLLDKQDLRQNESSFILEGLDRKSLWLEKTSGTTGTSLKIYLPKSMLPKFHALVEVMVRNVAGVSKDTPRAMMGGRPIIRGDTQVPPYWRYNRHWRQLYLSSYHVSLKTAAHYVGAIKRYGSRWITGYGSAIAALAETGLELGLSSLPLQAAIVSGDTLLPGMRDSIERFFECKCFDQYGQAEGIAFAMECGSGRMHILPWLGIIEILRENGTASAPGEIGEIVATGLLNDAMPLIRYRLGDYAAWAEDQSCSCGNMQPIITHLEGRVDDFLITTDGRRIGRLSTAIKRSPTIHSAQLVQDRPGHAYLLVRPGDNYQSVHAAAVRNDILERIGTFNLDVREVLEIPKTLQGKNSLVVRLEERPEMRDTYVKLINSN